MERRFAKDVFPDEDGPAMRTSLVTLLRVICFAISTIFFS
jgi:hypothetical protein